MNKITYLESTKQVCILSDYGKNQSIVFVFEQFGINQIFSLSKVYLLPKTSWLDLDVIRQQEPIIHPITDWLSPYYLVAANDIDIPNNENHLTGGNHGTSNGEGEPTSTFAGLEVFVDGQPIYHDLDNLDSFNGLNLTTTNLIEASNTHIVKPRAVLEEKVTYSIFKSKIVVSVNIQFKEEGYLYSYSGLQTNSEYYNWISIPNSALSGFAKIGETSYISGDYKKYGLANKVILKKQEYSDYLIVELLAHDGFHLGEHTSLIRMGEAKKNDKVYFSLVNGSSIQFHPGDYYKFKGSYEFVQSL